MCRRNVAAAIRFTISIAEIAERAGFGTAEHFSATCRRLRDASPRELRLTIGRHASH